MRIRIINWWPFRHWANAVTYPPVGAFVKRTWWESAGYNQRARLIRHERVHWDQYRRMGLLMFWARYLWGRWRHGYRNHPMEVEARNLAGD